MRTSIIAVSVMLAIEVLLTLLVVTSDVIETDQQRRSLIRMVVGLFFGGLILWGLYAGHRLAWQWGRVLGLIFAILWLILGGVTLYAATKPDVPLIVVVLGGGLIASSSCLFTVAFSLGTVAAKEHFGLRCPSCKRLSGNAGDFFFNTAKCNRCKITW